MLLPRAQRLQRSQPSKRCVFRILNAHLPQEGGVAVKAASRKVVKFEVDKEKDDCDLYEVESGFRVDPGRILVLVQKQDHREQHAFQTEQERSEERRVGKECRSRWERKHEKKKETKT